jgi:DNA (cytosine-5)-methyltransferase 1
MSAYTSLELCAGAGGQALGLEQAGFEHLALVENDPHPCNTLSLNRPHWQVIERDLREFDATSYVGVDLVAGGIPCQPFSIGGKQLGLLDERDLFPSAIRIIAECQPKLILLENVRGLADKKFSGYRRWILNELYNLGYCCEWKVINAADYGVCQARLRFILVGRLGESLPFPWPQRTAITGSVGSTLRDLMGENGWQGLESWTKKANGIAPCLVGGSKKHGGADLGPQRAKQNWLSLGIDGKGIADTAPSVEFQGNPRLTNRMASRLQGFSDDWIFAGKKTATYRQIGNAFPPPVAKALGKSLLNWIEADLETRYAASIESYSKQIGLQLALR